MIGITGAFDWPAALDFLARRAIHGVECVSGTTYQRTIRLGRSSGILSIAYRAHDNALEIAVAPRVGPIDEVHMRVRRMFDVDADLASINAHLSKDPFLSPLVSARGAIRVAGGWDPFEVAIRTVIGQQVSVARARQLNGVLVARCGARLPEGRLRPNPAGDRLRHAFPTPAEILGADLSSLGMPGARVETLRSVATAATEDPALFARGASLDETIARLRSIRGIGDWTAHYIAMRACRERDAFPASDVGLLRGAEDPMGRRPTPAALLERAEAWRPWRAYAAHHLWAADSTARGGVRHEVVSATLHS